MAEPQIQTSNAQRAERLAQSLVTTYSHLGTTDVLFHNWVIRSRMKNEQAERFVFKARAVIVAEFMKQFED